MNATPRLLAASVTFAALASAVPLAHGAGECVGVTRIHEVQGAGHISRYLGKVVETCGVVTAVAFNGYYIQDPEGDGRDATSDGIFVLEFGTKPEVGALLRLRGTVEESIPGGAATGNLSITRLSSPDVVSWENGAERPEPVVLGRGGRIPPAVLVISPDETDPPINLQDSADAAANRFNPEVDGIDFYESLEGMLVRIPDPVAVSAVRQFGTFSAELFVLANRGKDAEPEDARTARGGIYLQPDPDNRGDQNPERIQIQLDGTLFGSTDYPAVKVGDRLGDVTGVVGYSFGNFEVNALGPFDIHPGENEPEHTRLRGQGNQLTVATYNVLNLSAVPTDDAQREKIANQIAHNLRGPDIVALQEIQDNNGTATGELDAGMTLQRLVDAIHEAGGPAYAFADVPPPFENAFGGVPNGNIRNAFLWNPRRVTLPPNALLGLSPKNLAAGGVSDDNLDAFAGSRAPLLGRFRFRGREVLVINNHFSSRFGSTPIFGGLQPFVQAAEEARADQSSAINEYVANILDDDPHARVVVLGDLNTFEFTDELAEILPGTGRDRILHNLIDLERDDNRYTFIFEGNSQALDHVYVTRSLERGAKLDLVHVNVDFPRLFSSVVGSDHEPIVARLLPRRGDDDKDRDKDDDKDDDRDDDRDEGEEDED